MDTGVQIRCGRIEFLDGIIQLEPHGALCIVTHHALPPVHIFSPVVRWIRIEPSTWLPKVQVRLALQR
jgi:hypothetical protein